MPTPVVVLNMHYSGLGIARSLAPSGVLVFGLSAHADFPGSSSKYCQFEKAPDALLQPEQLKMFLLEFAKRFNERPILLPTRDHDIEFIGTYRAPLEERYIIPLAPTPVLERVMNKDACFSVARQCTDDPARRAAFENRAVLLTRVLQLELLAPRHRLVRVQLPSLSSSGRHSLRKPHGNVLAGRQLRQIVALSLRRQAIDLTQPARQPPHRLREMGVKLAVYHPMLFASIRAMQDSLTALRSGDPGRAPPVASFDDLKRIAGLPEYDRLSARYATKG